MCSNLLMKTIYFALLILICTNGIAQKKIIPIQEIEITDSTGCVGLTNKEISFDENLYQEIKPTSIPKGRRVIVFDYIRRPNSYEKTLVKIYFNGNVICVKSDDIDYNPMVLNYISTQRVFGNDSGLVKRKALALLVDSLVTNIKKSRDRLDLDFGYRYGLCINDYGIKESSGGYFMDFNIQFSNLKKGKIIKYMWVTAKALNGVDDIVSIKTFKIIGPVHYEKFGSSNFESAFSNGKIIEYVKLINIKIQYMDGSIASFSGKILSNITMTTPIKLDY